MIMRIKMGFFPEEESNDTGCQCQFSPEDKVLFCKRHGCMKTKNLYNLCQTRQDYFNMWEDGSGPNQSLTSREDLEKKEYQKGMILSQDNKVVAVQDQSFFMNDPEIPVESRGIGDTIAKITKATGIKKAVDTVFNAIGKDCGCTERQGKLNRMFPYKNAPKPKKTKGFFS
tara:strand:+ start:3330 stop:3842 length:513 start_codon:yes stop_codon:yes gene_type:complete